MKMIFPSAALAASLFACQHANVRHEPIEGLEFVFLPGPNGVKDVWIGRTEVTVRAYKGCVAHGGCEQEPLLHHSERNGKEACAGPGGDANAEQPLNCVSYEAAAAFCKWTRGRVPTAQEWERAALRPGDDALTAALADWTATPGAKGEQQIRRGNWRDAADQQRSWLSGTRPAGGFGPEVGFRCVQAAEP